MYRFSPTTYNNNTWPISDLDPDTVKADDAWESLSDDEMRKLEWERGRGPRSARQFDPAEISYLKKLYIEGLPIRGKRLTKPDIASADALSEQPLPEERKSKKEKPRSKSNGKAKATRYRGLPRVSLHNRPHLTKTLCNHPIVMVPVPHDFDYDAFHYSEDVDAPKLEGVQIFDKKADRQVYVMGFILVGGRPGDRLLPNKTDGRILLHLLYLARIGETNVLKFKSGYELAIACGYPREQAGRYWERCVSALKTYAHVKLGVRKTEDGEYVEEIFSPIELKLKWDEVTGRLRRIRVKFSDSLLVREEGETYVQVNLKVLDKLNSEVAFMLYLFILAWRRTMVFDRKPVARYLTTIAPRLGMFQTELRHIRRAIKKALDHVNEVAKTGISVRFESGKAVFFYADHEQ